MNEPDDRADEFDNPEDYRVVGRGDLRRLATLLRDDVRNVYHQMLERLRHDTTQLEWQLLGLRIQVWGLIIATFGLMGYVLARL